MRVQSELNLECLREEKVACKFRKLPWCCNDGDMMIVIEIGY